MKRLLDAILRACVPASDRDAIAGDIAQAYDTHARPSLGRWRAGLWYARQVAAASAFGVAERVRRRGVNRAIDPSHAAFLEGTRHDVRAAWRSLRHTPGFTAIATATLALGMGAATAIFSTVYPVLIEALPYPRPGDIVRIANVGAHANTAFGTYLEIAARSHSFDAIGVADGWLPVLAGDGDVVRLQGQRVSAGYLRALGATPEAGRLFSDAEDRAGGPHVAVVTDGFVQRRLGAIAPASAVGRSITINDVPYTIVGVLPRTFDHVLSPAAEIWAPLQFQIPPPLHGPGWGNHQQMIARRRPGVSLEAARRDLQSIAQTPVKEFPRAPWATLSMGLVVAPVADDVTAGVRPVLLVIGGAVLLLLAIACVNVTNLLLARAAGRLDELAVRAALGASRLRLIRQQIAESVTLSALGGVLGVAVADAGVRVLVALSPPGLPRLNAIHLDARVFLFALGLMTVAGLVIGLAPALSASRQASRHGAIAGSRRTIDGHRRTRGLLVVAEVALAVVLLVGAGLLLRSVRGLLSMSPGFDAAHVLTVQIQATGTRYRDDDVRRRFFSDVVDHVRALPGVLTAGVTSQLPLGDDVDQYGGHFASSAPNDDDATMRYEVTPGYFSTMHIQLQRGRLLDEADLPGGAEAVLINASLAARRFPGQDPIGQRFKAGPEVNDAVHPWDVVVGVVGDVKQQSLTLANPDAFYVSIGQWAWVDGTQTLVVRAADDAAALVPAVRRAIQDVDPNQPITRVATMAHVVERSEAQRAFALVVFETFGLAALALAAIGLYGVLSTAVAERTREMGVRAALGATRGAVLALVVRQGLGMAAAGAAIGLAGAAMSSRAMGALVFGVSLVDPVTYAGAAAILAGVCTAACWVPAARASRVDPLIALRHE